jgi:hypothetical protein
MKEEKIKVWQLEKLPIAQERKNSLYEKFDKKLLSKAVEYYHVQKHEPQDLGAFIEEICKRRLEKRSCRQK